MEWVENTASTVEEAKDRVLDDLGIDEPDAEIEVLEEPRPGLFGRTRGKARVRARVMPKVPAPKPERGAGRSRKARGTTDQGPESTDASGPSADNTSTAAVSADDPPSAAPTRRPRRAPSTVAGEAGGESGGRVEPGLSSSGNGDGGGSETLAFDDHVACVEDFVRGLVAAFGVAATVDVVEVDAETREVRVSGEDLGLLIGPRGLTIQAIHELARTVVYRRAPDGQEGRVRVDVAGYRQRRREALEQFARNIAEGVRSSGRSKALEPMTAPDRKVVHDTANAIDGVRTTSEGDEPRRYVVVAPDA